MENKNSTKHPSAYKIISIVVIVILAILFTFPLYWIITGSFKTNAAINSTTPIWWPKEWTLANYQKLFSRQTAPLFQFNIPFSSLITGSRDLKLTLTGPTVPAAVRWLINTVFMAIMSMILTCITASMAGYALAKKRFVGRQLLFTLIVCAMALPKQVILIPLLREMSSLNLYNTIWAVIFPIVGWPFGVFLMKQFSEGIPTEMLEAARIDGANPVQMFFRIKLPYLLSVQGPSLVTDFVKNINNFNVIYLLTQDVFVTNNQQLAQSNAKEIDLLVTWLFRLTQEYYNYKMAAVLGIMVFIVCAVFTVVCFHFINKKEATFS